ncbi:CopG family transcriptional regulator [Candidatus Poriferisodalis sp.]|uniref:ribbon-helix-helix domain-containing protein n=1 Tax=Candidatus Poriferisodalis sp. TaxID=3101277 RepID=UPI003C7022C8
MRVTLDLDDDVLTVARSLAQERGISIGAAMSELARRGCLQGPPTAAPGVPGFEVEADSGPMTPEMVRAASENW